VEGCRKDFDDLFERSYQANMRHKASREKRIDTNQSRLVILQRHDTEDFYTLKIRLETEVQTLEQQLEDMRATYQLNTEKLEYNFRVLHERNQENGKTKSANKRKLARLQDNLSNLKNKYASLDTKYKNENQDLSEAFKRYTQLLMDLGDKLARFIAADSQRFEDVWGMHEDQVKGKLLRLLQADKLIHEQQLGLLWFPPSEQDLNELFEVQRKEAIEQMRLRMLLGNPNMPNSASNEHQTQDAEEQRALAKSLVESPGIRQLCDLVTDNTQFLQDSQLSKMLQSLPRDKASMVAMKSVLKAMGIKTAQDTKILQIFLSTDAQQATPEQLHRMIRSATQQTVGSTSPKSSPGVPSDEMMVSEAEIVECLKNFLTYRAAISDEGADPGTYERLTSATTTLTPMAKSGSGQNLQGLVTGTVAATTPRTNSGPLAVQAPGRTRTSSSIDPMTGKKNVLSGKGGSSIWNKCANVVASPTISVWQELFKFLSKFNLILQERRELITSVDGLRAQNRELKMLLNQYLTSKVNGQLYVPPTATISRVDA